MAWARNLKFDMQVGLDMYYVYTKKHLWTSKKSKTLAADTPDVEQMLLPIGFCSHVHVQERETLLEFLDLEADLELEAQRDALIQSEG